MARHLFGRDALCASSRTATVNTNATDTTPIAVFTTDSPTNANATAPTTSAAIKFIMVRSIESQVVECKYYATHNWGNSDVDGDVGCGEDVDVDTDDEAYVEN